MKNLLFIFLILPTVGLSADTLDATKSMHMCWLGVDFSAGKFVGAKGFENPNEIRSIYFNDWNSLLIKEEWVHNLKGPLGLRSISFDTDNARENNAKIDMDNFIQEEPHNLSKDKVLDLISSYDYSAVTQDLAISMVVSSFNKLEEFGEIWIVFNFLKKKEVFTKKLKVDPSGLGLRSYWMGALREVLEVTNSRAKLWMQGKE